MLIFCPFYPITVEWCTLGTLPGDWRRALEVICEADGCWILSCSSPKGCLLCGELRDTSKHLWSWHNPHWGIGNP